MTPNVTTINKPFSFNERDEQLHPIWAKQLFCCIDCFSFDGYNNPPLGHGLGNIHGFALDGESYRQGQASAQTLTVPAVPGVRLMTTLI